MELAAATFGIFAALAFGLATLLGVLSAKEVNHFLIPYVVWVTVAGGCFGLIGLGFLAHNWVNKTYGLPIALPPPPVELDAETADPPAIDRETISVAAVSDASSENQQDTKSPEPIPERPWERPTPDYIANAISNAPQSTRQKIIDKFVGKLVSWDGRARGPTNSGNEIFVLHGLRYGGTYPQMFVVPADLPANEYLLVVPTDTPLHVDGTIDSIVYGVITLRDVTVTVLPEQSA